MATTGPGREELAASELGAPTSLTEPSALANHNAAMGVDASESAGGAGAGAGGIVVVGLGVVVVVEGGTVVVVVVVVDRGTLVVVEGDDTCVGFVVGGVLVLGVLVVEAAGGTVVVVVVVVVVVSPAGDTGDASDVLADVDDETVVEVEPAEEGESADNEGCALASGAKRASMPAAEVDATNVALSDHTTVRTSFWTI